MLLHCAEAGKALYLFSEEATGGLAADGQATKAKVTHVNFVPKDALDKGVDAREWAELVSKSIGGRAGGKAEGAQGVGEEGGTAVDDAILVRCAERMAMGHMLTLCTSTGGHAVVPDEDDRVAHAAADVDEIESDWQSMSCLGAGSWEEVRARDAARYAKRGRRKPHPGAPAS